MARSGLGLVLLACSGVALGAQLQGSIGAGGGAVSLTTEGAADWVHWGLVDVTSVNRKSSVTAQISGLTDIVSGATGRFGGNTAVHSNIGWTDGTPTASQAGFTGGLFYATPNSGYQLTLPAGGTTRTLKVYLGGFQARGHIEATLSDGSATPFTTDLENFTGPYDSVVNLSFQATSPSATLTFRYTLTQGAGNITIHAAALSQGAPVNQPPMIDPIGNKAVTAGSNLNFTVTATDTDGPPPIAMTISASNPALPGSATYTDNGNGTGTFNWTPTVPQAGTYDVTFRARDSGGSGAFSEQQISISVAGSGGSLAGGAVPVAAPSNVNLTTQGPADWVHWGLGSISAVNRKAGVAAQISALSNIVAAPSGWFGGNTAVHSNISWSDGTPTANQSGFTGGLFYATPNSGYQFTVPAGSTSRTLKVYLGGFQARGHIDASLSDGSATAFTADLQNLSGAYDHVVTLTFQAASPSATLSFRYTLTQGSGNVTIHAAALSQAAPVNQAPTINAVGNKTVTAGSNLNFTVTATDTDGPPPIAMTISASSPALPGSATYTDNGSGTGTFNWTPTAPQAGIYNVTFRARDNAGAGAFSEQQITITVNSGASGSLAGNATPVAPPSNVNLTTQGPADWVHWGLGSISAVNRKASVAAQISALSNIISGPSGWFGGNTAVHSNISWSDGTPTVNQPGFTGGLFYSTLNGGYEFTVPAGSTSRTLKVYLGGFQARGHIEASLSDASATPFTVDLQNLGGAYDDVVTLTFQAASPSATLNFRYTLTQGSGNVTIHAAALSQGAPVNQAPTINAIGNKTVAAGNNLNFTVTANDPDGPPPIAMSISASSPTLPGSATYTDNGNGTGTFNWTPTSGQAGFYSVTFRARDNGGSGAFSDQQITISVTSSSGGSMSGNASPVSAPSNVNLTTQGPTDWVHWGLTDISSVNRKSGVTGQISALSNIVSGPTGRFGGNTSVHSNISWTDGTPTASQSGSTAGLFYSTPNSGFQLTVPAGGSSRTLKIYLGGFEARGHIDATLSDGSAPAFVTDLQNLSGPYDHVVTLTFQASSPGATLTFRYTLTQGSGNITIHAAALAGGAVPPLSLPFTDDFSDGNFDGWLIVDETDKTSNWGVTSGALRQNNRVESVFAFDGSHHLGTFLYKPDATQLSDYRFRVTARLLSTGFQEDLGIMFRYQNPNNYYRIALNSRYGFARLEKKVGAFTPLATNARGYRPGEVLNFDIEVDGSKIFVQINGDPIFAVVDSSLTTGGFALYAQDFSEFDNVNVTALSSAPNIVLRTPLAHSSRLGNSINAAAEVRNPPTGASVQFILDGSLVQNDASAPYSVTYNNVGSGNHTMVAILRNQSSQEVDRDTNEVVGSSGRYLIGIGDSITNGVGDNYQQDNISVLERIIAAQGYEATLSNLLDSGQPDQPVWLFNEGIGGDETFDAAFTRIASIRARHAGAGTALICLGTNDALATVPSGAGCSGAACNGTFKGNLQALVDKIRFNDYPTNTQPSGITPVVALTPPAFNSTTPWTSATNNRIRTYNDVIRLEIAGAQVGPDFFVFYLPSATVNLASLFADTLHPNGLGYLVMARLWYNALNPGAPLPIPFILNNLGTSGSVALKQNLLGAGDSYYVDAAHALVNVPAQLTNGRWIMTSSGSVANTSSNYVTFNLDRTSTVYVAFDGGASTLPAWMSGFSATGLSVTTTDPLSPSLTVYSRVYAPGAVTLGGTAQAPSSGANSAYVATVVEQ